MELTKPELVAVIITMVLIVVSGCGMGIVPEYVRSKYARDKVFKLSSVLFCLAVESSLVFAGICTWEKYPDDWLLRLIPLLAMGIFVSIGFYLINKGKGRIFPDYVVLFRQYEEGKIREDD